MKRPIGIFDSGIGGLTVLREIIKTLPGEDTIYLGDTGRVPYGTKSAETVTRYSLDNARFLLRFDIKLLVVACNTASAYSLPRLKEELPIPVVGVVLPGARKAVEVTRNQRVGVIGTEGTIKSGAYFDAIKKINPKVAVFTKACPLFVPLAEEGWTNNKVAYLTAKTYLSYLKGEGIDTLVLGCTHYPLLRGVIGMIIGEEVTLIDSGQEIAREVADTLLKEGLLETSSIQGTHRFFVTDAPDRFARVGRRFFGNGLEAVELVDILETDSRLKTPDL